MWRLVEQHSRNSVRFVTQLSPFLSHRHSFVTSTYGGHRDSGHSFRGGAPLAYRDSGHPFPACLPKLNPSFVVSFIFCPSLTFVVIFRFHSFIEKRQRRKQTTSCDFKEIIKIWCSWSWFIFYSNCFGVNFRSVFRSTLQQFCISLLFLGKREKWSDVEAMYMVN